MIVFVQLSPRRWIALDVNKYESSWRTARPGNQSAQPDDAGLIYSTGTLIAGPADWDTCTQKAVEYAKRDAPEKIIPYPEWKAWQDARMERIKELNKGLGLGAVLGRPKGDEPL